MKTFDVKYIESLGPCYPPTRYLPEDWSGTILDIVRMSNIPFSDRLWLVMRYEFVSEKLMRLLAIWCVGYAYTNIIFGKLHGAHDLPNLSQLQQKLIEMIEEGIKTGDVL